MPAAGYASISNLKLAQSSTLIIDIAGRNPALPGDTDLSDNFDYYNVNNSLTVDGGKFIVRFFNGFQPVSGDRFRFIGCTNITQNRTPVIEIDPNYPAPGFSVSLEKTALGYEAVIS